MNLSKQKALDADPKAIQQIVFKGISGQKLRLYTVFEKSKETMFNFDKVFPYHKLIICMVEYSKVNVKLSDSQLNKLKSAVKY